MCDDLNDLRRELKFGKEAAELLVEHLIHMGADKMEIPFINPDDCSAWKVTIERVGGIKHERTSYKTE